MIITIIKQNIPPPLKTITSSKNPPGITNKQGDKIGSNDHNSSNKTTK